MTNSSPPSESSPSAQPQPKFERDEDFASLYANNVWYEPSVWDLKLIFGQLDQLKSPNVVTQHTAIAVSWMQVKLMIYFLQIQLAAYEFQNGNVKLPEGILPPPPEPLPSEIQNNPHAKSLQERILNLREQLLK